MVRRGRGVDLHRRLRALERATVACRSCARAAGLHAEIVDDDGVVVAVSFGDRREYCPECGARPSGGVTLRRGVPPGSGRDAAGDIP